MGFLSFLSNPFTLAVAAVVTIGVIAYEIINRQKEESQSHRGRRGSGPNRQSDPSSTETFCFSTYDDTKNDVRKRKPTETKTESCSQTKAKSREDVQPSDRGKGSSRSSEFDEKEYYRNVFSNIDNDIKNLNKDDDEKKTFHKSIESECPASSASLDANEIKLINTGKSGANELLYRNTPSTSSSRRNVNHETIPNDVNDLRSTNETPENGTNSDNDTTSDNSLCMACEEISPNAVAYPCEHCYLCIDCATMMHRIYTKCTICDAEIDYFMISRN